MGFILARSNAGMSQRAVAAALGVSDAAVSMWETGKTQPRASLLIKIAELYGCTTDELLRPDTVKGDA